MYVYIMGAYGEWAWKTLAVKIGVTTDIGKRLAQLQTGQFYDLRVIAAWRTDSRILAFRVESECHERFKLVGIRGEWFHSKMIESYISDISERMRCAPIVLTDAGMKKTKKRKAGREARQIEAELDMAHLSQLRAHGFCELPAAA